eukprot:Awhi_evm1s3047
MTDKKEESNVKDSMSIDAKDSGIKQSSMSLALDDVDLEQESVVDGDEEPKSKFSLWREKNKKQISWGIKIFFACLWVGFLIWALVYDANSTAIGVAGFTAAVVALNLFSTFVWPKISPTLGLWTDKAGEHVEEKWKIYRFVFAGVGVAIILVFMFVIMDVISTPYNLVPFGGYCLFLGLEWGLSFHRTKVIWRPVIGGFTTQFILAILILRTDPGRAVFDWIGDAVTWYLNFLSAGSIFVYGETYYDHFFAFSVLPTVAYLSSTVSILYYFGAIQWVCRV